MVEIFLAEAADTLYRLPSPRPSGYFNTWPEILRDELELSWTAEGPTPPGWATPTAVTQAEQTLLWFRWLDPEDHKLVWKRVNGSRWKTIAAELNIDRTTGWRRYKMALTVIAAHLNARDSNNVATLEHATS